MAKSIANARASKKLINIIDYIKSISKLDKPLINRCNARAQSNNYKKCMVFGKVYDLCFEIKNIFQKCLSKIKEKEKYGYSARPLKSHRLTQFVYEYE